MSNRRGWTMIELLIVIVVLGLLSSLAVLKYIDLSRTAFAAKIVGEFTTVRLAAYNYEADHNNQWPGDQGPGIFLPTGWIDHRAQFGAVGVALPSMGWARTLDPLAPEGVYRVREPFYCCERQCRLFERELVVQLAYTPEAGPVVLPFSRRDGALVLPPQGNLVDRATVARLSPLQVLGWT